MRKSIFDVACEMDCKKSDSIRSYNKDSVIKMELLAELNESLETERINLGVIIALYKQLMKEADNFLIWRSEKNINALNAANYCAEKLEESICKINEIKMDIAEEERLMDGKYTSFWTSIPT